MRIDLLLVRLRLAKSRAIAKRWVEDGHIRCNRLRVTCASQAVSVRDVLTLPIGEGVRVIEILALPERRGPAAEALAHYQVLDAA
ncbi:S4 domain-containing protein [Aurantiacibacter gangjinensis]|uniref:Uncharacterized protein n=1 Tax=Aurantiacibacter gangjinensis TaxID=502682 RepID=A0A0G9MLG5_9SPHN|nr:S4 domain-containing protein [Aurantiacibacter gangjinensis]APE27534.1 Ribosome-associated heat shock protein implicated in the recycling of the 50S subunit (S4-like protein) [Aurantiacibacter gangjinensis]KLE31586.1 hypothetical protein AAW01_08495 [Aurantiacibacter gangjinensis]